MGMSHACVNSSPPGQNGHHFAADISKCIFMKFVPKGPINHIPALVQIMAWRWSATSHYLIQCWIWLLTRPVIRDSQCFLWAGKQTVQLSMIDTPWRLRDVPIMFDNIVILLLLLTSHVPEACISREKCTTVKICTYNSNILKFSRDNPICFAILVVIVGTTKRVHYKLVKGHNNLLEERVPLDFITNYSQLCPLLLHSLS